MKVPAAIVFVLIFACAAHGQRIVNGSGATRYSAGRGQTQIVYPQHSNSLRLTRATSFGVVGIPVVTSRGLQGGGFRSPYDTIIQGYRPSSFGPSPTTPRSNQSASQAQRQHPQHHQQRHSTQFRNTLVPIQTSHGLVLFPVNDNVQQSKRGMIKYTTKPSGPLKVDPGPRRPSN